MAHTPKHKRKQEEERIAENLRISKQVTEESSRRTFQGRTRQDLINLEEEELRRNPQLREQRLILQQRATEFAQTQAQEVLETPEQIAIREERERLIREQTPEVFPLQPTVDPGLGGDPQAIGGELFPILGPLGTFGKRNFAKFFGLGLPVGIGPGPVGITPADFKDFDETIGLQFQPDNVSLRTAALTQIANNEINRGLTKNERVGEFAEALGLGDLTNFIAEKPSENVQTLLKGIRLLKTDATDVETKVIRGTLTIPSANVRLNEIEEELVRVNFRIQMLIQSSPELKFDSDGVNFIEQKILQANRRVFDARNGILEGATQDPTELQILADLRASISAEDFEI